jgi:hypothetical protein
MRYFTLERFVLATSFVAWLATAGGCAGATSKPGSAAIVDTAPRSAVGTAPTEAAPRTNCRWVSRPVLTPKGGTAFTYKRVCS